jgi:hypothetical protein
MMQTFDCKPDPALHVITDWGLHDRLLRAYHAATLSQHDGARAEIRVGPGVWEQLRKMADRISMPPKSPLGDSGTAFWMDFPILREDDWDADVIEVRTRQVIA